MDIAQELKTVIKTIQTMEGVYSARLGTDVGMSKGTDTRKTLDACGQAEQLILSVINSAMRKATAEAKPKPESGVQIQPTTVLSKG